MSSPDAPKRRMRITAAVFAGVSALGVVGASAASLGGITSDSLGADTAVVSSCDSDGVTMAYTDVYSASLGRYQTTSVAVAGIDAACSGKSLNVTLEDSSGASLASGTVASISSTSATVALSGSGANANAVVAAAAVVTG